MARTMRCVAATSGILTILFAALWCVTVRGILSTVAITCGTVCYHMTMRMLVGWLFDRTMANTADCGRKWYHVSEVETAIYETLRVKAWKGRIPTYDETLFDPARHTWEEIAQAMCQAELVHETNAVLSFVPLGFSLWFGAFPVFLATSLLAAAYDLRFAMVQRYNRPRVLRLAERRCRTS